MKRLAALAVTSLLALSACSGGGTTTRAPGVNASSPTKQILSAYRVPLVHVASVDAAAAAGAKLQRDGTRGTQGLGGLPTLDGLVDTTFAIVDAPYLGDGAKVNVAIVGVQAVGADGVAYNIVTYSSPVLVNMLDYKSSALVLGHNPIPKQQYTKMRLLVQGTASSVYAFGQNDSAKFGSYDASHIFTADTSDTSAIDFPILLDASNSAPTILADFNTVESVTIAGNVAQIGSIITAAVYDNSTIISGTIVNNAGNPVSSAVIAAIDASGNVAQTTITEADGSFELHAIVGASYGLIIHNSYTTRAGDTVQAKNADGSADMTGPHITAPPGYKADIGKITD